MCLFCFIYNNNSCKNKFLSKTILACVSWAQQGWIHGRKKNCQTISWHCHFNLHTNDNFILCFLFFIFFSQCPSLAVNLLFSNWQYHIPSAYPFSVIIHANFLYFLLFLYMRVRPKGLLEIRGPMQLWKRIHITQLPWGRNLVTMSLKKRTKLVPTGMSYIHYITHF